MKKILLLSLAVIFLCWCLAAAATDAGKLTSNSKQASKVQKATPTTPKVEQQEIQKPITARPVVETQTPAKVENKKNPGVKVTSTDFSSGAMPVIQQQKTQPAQSEKQVIRVGAPGQAQDTKYHGPGTMPSWYSPSLITDNLLTEGFEGGALPAGWTDVPGGSSMWLYDGGTDHGPGSAHTGSYAAYYNIYDYPTNTIDDLVTPSMDFSAHSGAYVLSFWSWHNSGSDSMNVFVSENSVERFLYHMPNTAAWTQNVVTFISSSTDGKIIFRGYSRYGIYNIYIDDVSVDDAPASGRCCYGNPTAPSCADNSIIDCNNLGGTWDPNFTCSDPCPAIPVGDICAYPIVTPDFSVGSTYEDIQNTANFNNNYNAHGNDVIYRFTLTENATLDLTLCNTSPGFDTWMGVWADGDCGSAVFLASNDDSPDCVNSSLLSHIPILPLVAGTYYLDVEAYGATNGTYTLDITVTDYLLPPPNDECANAEAITGPYPVTVMGTNVNATQDCPSLLGWNGVWYTIDLPYTANNLSIDWCPTTSGPIQYVGIVWMPDCGCTTYNFFNYTWPTCENTGFVEPYFTASIPGPATIYLPAWVSADPGGGESPMDFGFTVDVQEAPPPPDNDNCEDVTPVVLTDGVPVQFTGTVESSTNDCSQLTYPQVWEAVTLTDCMNLVVDYCGTTPYFNSVTVVVTDACPCGNLIFYNTVDWTLCGDGNATIYYNHLAAGTYYIPVSNAGGFGPYVLNVVGTACPPPPANDDCANAEAIGEVENLPFSTGSASFDGSGECQTAPNVWYLYTATVDGPMNISLCGSLYDTKMAVYDGSDCPQPPPPPPTPVPYQAGEDFGTAAAITDALPVAYSGTTVGYIADYAPSCMYSPGPDVVYSYTPSADEIVTVTLCGSGFDTGLSIFDAAFTEIGCDDDYCGLQSGIENVSLTGGSTYYFVIDGYYGASGAYVFNLSAQGATTLIECNDDFCGLQSQISLDVTTGHQYLIEVGGFGTATGDGFLTISPPPANDNCGDVTPVQLLPDTPLQFTGNNTGATVDCPAGGYPEVWEAITTSECMSITIDYCGTDPYFNNVYIVITDQCPCGPFIFANNWDNVSCADGLNWTVRFTGVPAGTYWLPVLAATGAMGPYVMNVTGTACPPPPANDNCADAEQIGEVDAMPFTTAYATPDNRGDCISSNDIWYLYTATVNGPMAISLCGSSYDTKLAVYDGPDCPAGAPTPVPYQAGENIASAVAITDPLPVVYTGTTAGYLNDYDEVCSYTSTSPDVVYSYTPTGNEVVDITLCGSSYDTKLFIYENSYTPGAPFACNDDAFWCDNGSDNDPYKSALFGLNFVGGNTYYIVVDGYGGGSGAYQFNMSTEVATTLIECNDDFCGTASQVTITAVVGHQYLIQVGGSGAASGDGILTIAPPPPNPCDNSVYSNGEATGFAYGSQCAPSYPFTASVADDFILSGSDPVTIDTVVAFFAFWNGTGSEDPSLFNAVGVTFYADNGGVPGGEPLVNDPSCTHQDNMGGNGIIATEDIPAGSFTWDAVGGNFRLVLPITDVVLQPATTYWLEVMPQIDFPPQCGWVNTDQINGYSSMQEFQILGVYPWTALNIDMAFCLIAPHAPSIPALTYSPSSFTMSCQRTFADTANLYISNTGTRLENLTYDLSVDQGTWMVLSSTSGSIPAGVTDTILFIADAGTVPAGTYNGTITINSNDPALPTVGIPVEFTVTPLTGQCTYVVGDANYNGTFNGLDVTYSVSYFKGGPPPPYSCDCPPHGSWYVSGDVNASCNFNGLDVTYMVAYFKGGPIPHPCADCPPAGRILIMPKAPASVQPQGGVGQ
jgi:hypothetical protein